jgi:dihydroorotase
MEDVILVSAQLVLPGHPLHLQKKHLHLRSGVLLAISDTPLSVDNALYVESPNLKVSWGWFDLRAYFPDPGFEQKETLMSGRRAAAAGGFTEVALLPNTQPVVDDKDTLRYLQSDNAHELVQLHPIAAVTKKAEGKEFSEMIDLHRHGALAFSDGLHPIQDSDLVLKTLLYLQPFNGLLIQRPEDTHITRFGIMNEGSTAVLLGLKGMPALAEHLMIQRDLALLEYAGGRIHFSCISSAHSVELIRQAKARGLAVTADVAAPYLLFDETALHNFDTVFKLNPPLRTAEDRAALWQGLRDGTLDAIVSDHQPHEIEAKQLELDLAAFGMSSIETVFAMSTMKSKLPTELVVEKLSVTPRKIVGISLPPFETNQVANLTVFDDSIEWLFEKSRSLSPAHPLLGQRLKGKVLGVVNNQKMEWFL